MDVKHRVYLCEGTSVLGPASSLVRFESCAGMANPAMRVWLMMVVVCDCVCRLIGPPGVCMWVSGGGGQKEFVSCCNNLYYGFFLYIYIQYVCLLLLSI